MDLMRDQRKPFFIAVDLSFALLTNGSLVDGLGIKVTRKNSGHALMDVQICDYKPSGIKGKLDGGERVMGESRRERRKARS